VTREVTASMGGARLERAIRCACHKETCCLLPARTRIIRFKEVMATGHRPARLALLPTRRQAEATRLIAEETFF
jgi:hypothetical protein